MRPAVVPKIARTPTISAVHICRLVIYLVIPNAVSDGVRALMMGPIRPAKNALAKVFGSEIPERYRAPAHAAAARKYDRAIALSFVFMVLLFLC